MSMFPPQTPAYPLLRVTHVSRCHRHTRGLSCAKLVSRAADFKVHRVAIGFLHKYAPFSAVRSAEPVQELRGTTAPGVELPSGMLLVSRPTGHSSPYWERLPGAVHIAVGYVIP